MEPVVHEKLAGLGFVVFVGLARWAGAVFHQPGTDGVDSGAGRDYRQPITTHAPHKDTARILRAVFCLCATRADDAWWGQLGSNQRPSGYEPPALTAELWPLFGTVLQYSKILPCYAT